MNNPAYPAFRALILTAALALGGCSSHEQDVPGNGSGAVAYSGVRAGADIETLNASRLARNLLGVGTGGGPATAGGAADMPTNPGLRAALGVLGRALADDRGVFAAAAGVRPLISVMEDCTDGGRKVQTAGTSTLSIQYIDCRAGPNRLNGAAVRVGNARDHTTTLHDLRISSTRVDLGFSGSFGYRRSGSLERLALYLVVADGHRARTLEALDLVLLESRVTEGVEVSVNGRLLDSEHGALEVETDDTGPLFYAGNDAYPSSGRITVRGRGEERFTLLVLSNTQVNITLDTDGDGTADIDRTMNWSELEAEQTLI